MFLEKYKYVARETDVEIYSDEENYDDSDEENSNEKIQMKKIKYINSLFEKNKHEMINLFLKKKIRKIYEIFLSLGL